MNVKWMSVLIATILVLSVSTVIPAVATETNPPSVTNPVANPSTIANDGSEYTELTVDVIDDTAVDNVTVDLTPIGGKVVYMSCKGNYTENGKVISVFNYTTNVTCPPGTYNLVVNATDATENRNYNNTKTISLKVGLPEGVIPVYFEPSKKVVPIGQEFTVNITVGSETNPAYNVTSDEISIEFNPAVLQVVSVTNGPYLASSGYSTFPMTPTIDNVNGKVTNAAESIYGGKVAPTGTGVIWIITFNATSKGSSYVNFTKVWLAEPPGTPADLLPVAISNGTIEVGEYGAINGTVTEGDGTTPIEGAIVNVTQDSTLINSTSTNEIGEYLITELPAGSYNVTVSKTYPDRPSMNCAPTITSVEVVAGETTILDIKLRHIADMYWDGSVNMFDLNILAAAWNTCEGDLEFNPIANLYSADNCINMFDLNIFAAEWDTTYY